MSLLNYEIHENNALLGYTKWKMLRDFIYDFFNDENTKPADSSYPDGLLNILLENSIICCSHCLTFYAVLACDPDFVY
jgi:hypothetical protein